MGIRTVRAVTFLARDIASSVSFYQKLGFRVEYGGPGEAFTTLRAGEAVVNLIHDPGYRPRFWGRVILHVDDVDALHRRITAAGLGAPPPEDAPWGERYFHVRDPDGHEVSLARPLEPAREGGNRGS